jgi:hypothetical protein
LRYLIVATVQFDQVIKLINPTDTFAVYFDALPETAPLPAPTMVRFLNMTKQGIRDETHIKMILFS